METEQCTTVEGVTVVVEEVDLNGMDEEEQMEGTVLLEVEAQAVEARGVGSRWPASHSAT